MSGEVQYAVVFLFGLIIGSFLNVCVYRIPLGKSIVLPRSSCPFCEHPIGWFDNIPLVSFLLLAGKCRHCRRLIPLRYFLVEFLTAASGVALLYFFSMGAQFFVYWLFTSALIVITFVDIEHQEIPDVISIPGIFIGIIFMTVFRLDGAGTYGKTVLNSISGALAGGGSMFLLGYFGEKIFQKEALGGGDVKLMSMIGAFLGWKLVLLTFFLAPVFGAGVGLFMKIRFNKDVIPYGPYLSIGALVSLLYGERILRYLFVL